MDGALVFNLESWFERHERDAVVARRADWLLEVLWWRVADTQSNFWNEKAGTL